jgi:hypothetical protein
MSTTPNHRVLARDHLAEATLLADAGRTADAHSHLLSAADHALLALAASQAVDLSHAAARRDRVAIAVPGSTDLECLDEPDLDACFGLVQTLIDACLAQPATPPPANVPLCGGPSGALRWRGAETAGRALRRLGAALKR